MTPEISSAQLCGDAPYPLLTTDQGLNLVDFAFAPHVQGTPEDSARMQSYADQQKRVLYGCHDGDGIIVAGDTVTMVGNVITVAPTGV